MRKTKLSWQNIIPFGWLDPKEYSLVQRAADFAILYGIAPATMHELMYNEVLPLVIHRIRAVHEMGNVESDPAAFANLGERFVDAAARVGGGSYCDVRVGEKIREVEFSVRFVGFLQKGWMATMGNRNHALAKQSCKAQFLGWRLLKQSD